MSHDPSYTQTKMMLLGTFHFEDAGLDMYKPQFDVGILSEKRQREVAEVVELLAAFAPTKIAVERRQEHQAELNENFRAYLQGEFELSGSETHQLGFRLAERLGHSSLYCVDAWGRYYEPPLDLETYAQGLSTKELSELLTSEFEFDPYENLEAYAHQHDQKHILSQWRAHLQEEGARGDTEKLRRTIRENLLVGNSKENVFKGHALYLTGWFKVGVGNEYPGVDVVTAWYSRNLRIFANLQRITETPDERILLVIGSGHVPILRHCVQASPEYDLVEVSDYLG